MPEIYALTDDNLTPCETIEKQIIEILENGIKFVQYRSKKQLQNKDLIKKLISLCEDFNAKFIINDNIKLAKELNAHGVHIGKDDENLNNTINFLGKKFIVGVSCYNNITLAKNAQNNGATYVAFGSAFKSPTKPNAIVSGIEIIKKAKDELHIPICIIGGINEENISTVIKKAPDMIAIVNAIYKPNSITENLINLKKKMI